MSPSPSLSATHLVLIPAYNPGPLLLATVTAALAQWRPVLVVVDGSTDRSHLPVAELARREPGLRLLVREQNGGKGAAALAGLRAAADQGFTHALVMDADGQHPAASIPEFMAASQQRPEAMILGRPVFGPEAPRERLLGRKLSIGLVHGETLGRVVDDPLFGFRVYPVRPLLAALGARRRGRRYEFDTEAAVRLVWAGVPALNLPAPVRYLRRGEAGVSHFHYGRDNLRLAWMHVRLIAELLAWRLPARLWRRPVRRGRTARLAAALLGLAVVGRTARAAERGAALIRPELRLNLKSPAPAWQELFRELHRRKTVEAPFEEHRWFPFRREPVVLKGVVRIDASRGLSLDYEKPEPRIVIIDDHGMLVREKGRDTSPPADPHVRVIDSALLHVLRFDLAALARDFRLYGRRDPPDWTLALVPRAPEMRRTLGSIIVGGTRDEVRRIQLRRSAHERVDILVGPPRPEAPFSAADLHRYFR